MNWKNIDVMGAIHSFGANRRLLLKTYENGRTDDIIKTLSPYISIRIASENEKGLFRDEQDCVIAEQDANGGLRVLECIDTEELYKRFEQITLDNVVGMLKFKTNFWEICNEEFNYIKCIQEFDRGIECICVTDSDGNFIGSFEEHDLKKNFFCGKLPKLSAAFYESRGEHKKRDIAAIFMNTPAGRIPVMENGKIVGFYDRVNNAREKLASIDFAKEQIIDYFRNCPRVMLSSEECKAGGIFEALAETNEVIVLDEFNLGRLYDGSVELLVCCGEPISGSPIPCMGIEQIYLDILSGMVADKLHKAGAELVVMYIPKKKQIPGWQYRVQGVTRERDFYVAYREGEMCVNDANEDRYASIVFEDGIYSYSDFKTGTLTLEGGCRRIYVGDDRGTADDESGKHTLYVAGYCPLLGFFSEDKNTIASELQRLCDADGTGYRVVQCASPSINTAIPQVRSEINIYMNLLQGKFFIGDIVCVSGLSAFKSLLPVQANYKSCNSADAFLHDRSKDCFADNSVSHLTTIGNKVYAQWLFKEVLYDLFSRE